MVVRAVHADPCGVEEQSMHPSFYSTYLEYLTVFDWSANLGYDMGLYFSERRYEYEGIIPYFDAVILIGLLVSSFYIFTIGGRRWRSGPHIIDVVLDLVLFLLFLSSGVTNLYPTFVNNISPFKCAIENYDSNRCLFRLLNKYLGWALAVLYLIMFFISRFTYKHRRANAEPIKPHSFSPDIPGATEVVDASDVDKSRKPFNSTGKKGFYESGSFQGSTNFSDNTSAFGVGESKDYYESHDGYYISDTKVNKGYGSSSTPPLPSISPSSQHSSSTSPQNHGFNNYNYNTESRNMSFSSASTQQQNRPPLPQHHSYGPVVPQNVQYAETRYNNTQNPEYQYVRGTRQYYYQEAQENRPYQQGVQNTPYQQQYQEESQNIQPTTTLAS
ncbi:6738_t:CDS:2 [Acaulospora morrowiae]|uniref:6738_t:CDS:1 n=1 Tax=Acaulospora morrowiae TaxID=94023 RepID=A0A9N8VRD2_9GLOM|nr:6738_t:CDS:2 [Acaulospora morrowiae]